MENPLATELLEERFVGARGVRVSGVPGADALAFTPFGEGGDNVR
jgi:hypothetical protein